MSSFPAGTVAWAEDPTNAHEDRPVIILSHKNRPFNAVECTVMCLGTSAKSYDHYSPELTNEHLTGISFNDSTHLMPWALYTIPPAAIHTTREQGNLTEEGIRLAKKALISLFEI